MAKLFIVDKTVHKYMFIYGNVIKIIGNILLQVNVIKLICYKHFYSWIYFKLNTYMRQIYNIHGLYRMYFG